MDHSVPENSDTIAGTVGMCSLLSSLPYAANPMKTPTRKEPFWARRDSIEPNSYGDVAGWVAGCLSQPVLCQND